MCIEDKIIDIFSDVLFDEQIKFTVDINKKRDEVSTLINAKLKKDWEEWSIPCKHESFKNNKGYCNKINDWCDFDKCPGRKEKKIKRDEVKQMDRKEELIKGFVHNAIMIGLLKEEYNTIGLFNTSEEIVRESFAYYNTTDNVFCTLVGLFEANEKMTFMQFVMSLLMHKMEHSENLHNQILDIAEKHPEFIKK